MSFLRLIYYSAIVGGWAGFLGWFLGEAIFMHRAAQVGLASAVATTALCGGFIAGGLGALSLFSRGKLRRGWPRLAGCFIGGAAAGVVGSFVGNFIFRIFEFPIVPRALGFMVMGMAIGCVDGLFSLNWRRVRNGLIGGALGGLVGGLIFEPLDGVIHSPMSSRAVAFVLLGLFIGFFIGLVQVLLLEAWLTVEAGFRPGRQHMLSGSNFSLGTSERASLVFIAQGAQGVEPTHVQIEKQRDGTFFVRDNRTRTGTFLNDQPLSAPAPLRNGDVIRFGINRVRFNEKLRASAAAAPVKQSPPAKPRPAPVEARSAPAVAALPVARPVAAQPPKASVSAAPSVAQQSADVCPVCGRKAAGPQGKRRCTNCGVVF